MGTLFIKQMVKVSVALRDDLNVRKQSIVTLANSVETIRIQNNASIHLNENQTEIIHSATRYSVLSIIALLSTQLNLLIFCIASMAEWDMNDWFICGIFFCLDCIINTIVCTYYLEQTGKRIIYCVHLVIYCLGSVSQK